VHLTLIRHTKVLAHGLCYGRHDPPLADTFEQEAAAIKERLQALSGIPFYCSPAQRCRLLASYLQVEHQHEDRLQEINFGDWDGRNWLDIPREHTEAWLSDFVNHIPPNGESYVQLSQRVLGLMRELASHHEQVGLITHSGVIHAVLAHVKGIPLAESYEKLTVGYGEVVQVEFDWC
jgi:alpha-ribazole phosphatase